MPTPFFFTGLEYGTISSVCLGLFDNTSGGGATASTLTPRTGAYSMRTTGAGEDWVAKTMPGGNNISVHRLYFRFSAYPSGGRGGIFLLEIAASGVNVQVKTTGEAGIYIGGTTQIGIDSPVLSVDTWYRLDIRINSSANPWVVDWVITDDTTETEITSQSATSAQAAASSGNTKWGNHTTNIWSDLFIDDIYVSLVSGDYPIGAGKVIKLSPSSDGTHNTGAAGNFTNAAGTNITDATTDAWTNVEEIPPTSTERIEQRLDTSGTRYVEIQFEDQAETTYYNGVRGYLGQHSAAAQASNGKAVIRRKDGTEFVLVSGDFSSAFPCYNSVIVDPPAAGWTSSQINALKARVGFGLDVTPDIYFDWLMLEVDVSTIPFVDVPTPYFLTGLEYGTADLANGLFDTTFNSPTTDSMVKRTGDYSMKVTGSGERRAGRALPASNFELVGRFFFRFSAFPTGANGGIFLAWADISHVDNIDFQIKTTGEAGVYVTGTQVGTDSPVLSIDTWYRLDIRINTSTATWSIDWIITDDSTGVEVTLQNATIAKSVLSLDSFEFGNHSVANWSSLYIDDIFISIEASDYPIGNGKVIKLSPSADGTHNTGAAGNFTNASGTNITDATTDAWTNVEEIPPTTTERIEQRLDTSGTRYVEIQFEDQAETDTYQGINAYLHENKPAAIFNSGKAVIRRTDGTEFTLINGSFTSGIGRYRRELVFPPVGGWTSTEINNLVARLGFGTDVDPDLYFDWLMLEVDVAIPAGGLPIEVLDFSSFSLLPHEPRKIRR